MLWLTFPLAVIASPSLLDLPLDLALNALIPYHSHVAINYVISDYCPRPARLLLRTGWVGVTAVSFFGLLKLNLFGPGIVKTLKAAWGKPPKKVENQIAVGQMSDS